MERDIKIGGDTTGLDISTHTLTWSVTGECGALTVTPTISTHTLTWSVTGETRRNLCRVLHFNSHAHVERDVKIGGLKNMRRISTHTLTWSVTIVTKDEAKSYEFQLTRSRGA